MKKRTAKLGIKVLSYPILETYHIAPDTHVILRSRNKKFEVRYASLDNWIGVSFHDKEKESTLKTGSWLCHIKTVSQFKIIKKLFFSKLKELP